MNRLSKELAEQAGYPDSMTYGQDKVLERLIHLVVEECINTLSADDGATHHEELLLQRFGLK
jgi:hypothetical protein